MKIPSGKSLLPLLISLPAIVFVGCDRLTAPQGSVEVQLSQSSQLAQSFAESLRVRPAGEEAVAGQVHLALISSIEVTVTRVDARRAGGPESEDAGWTSLYLTEDAKQIDLLALPHEGGVTIAAAALPDGEYDSLRLFVEDATITFSESVTLGGDSNPHTLEEGTYSLRIPSADETGIKISAPFTVSRQQHDETTIVSVTFDGAASVQSLQSTAQGVQMSPVLLSRNQ